MAKRAETVAIEQCLIRDTKEKRIYGCEEVTIGFYRDGGGDEHVDFMTMDSKGIIRCYEIKVTLPDLKSHAKKSFYGHYNYLVITQDLYDKILKNNINLKEYGIPDYVGITICNLGKDNSVPAYTWNMWRKPKKCVKQKLSPETESMLKESLVRTLYYKMDKYRSISNGEAYQKEKTEKTKYKKLYEEERRRAVASANSFSKLKLLLQDKYGVRFHIHAYPDAYDLEDAISEFVDAVIEKKIENQNISAL